MIHFVQRIKLKIYKFYKKHTNPDRAATSSQNKQTYTALQKSFINATSNRKFSNKNFAKCNRYN